MNFDEEALKRIDAHGEQLMDEASERQNADIAKLVAAVEKAKEQS
jgi:hypothetical protein